MTEQTSESFREHMRETREHEAPRMEQTVAAYMAATVDLPKRDRLDFNRRKEFFLSHFSHLSGITRAWIVSDCVMHVSDLCYAELRAQMEAEEDADD